MCLRGFSDNTSVLCVLQVVLPVLCSYMSHWWEHGPENNPNRADSCCTSVTSEHMNTLLGNILKIIYNNLGIDEGAWMKRLAGKCVSLCVFVCVCAASPSPLNPAHNNNALQRCIGAAEAAERAHVLVRELWVRLCIRTLVLSPPSVSNCNCRTVVSVSVFAANHQ